MTPSAAPLLAMASGLDTLFIFVLSTFVGFEVIRRVPTLLHTPLMSAGNAICGIILVGAILVAAHAEDTLEVVLALASVGLATVNVVGGFLVTDRMLKMFKPREPAAGRGPGEGA